MAVQEAGDGEQETQKHDGWWGLSGSKDSSIPRPTEPRREASPEDDAEARGWKMACTVCRRDGLNSKEGGQVARQSPQLSRNGSHK